MTEIYHFNISCQKCYLFQTEKGNRNDISWQVSGIITPTFPPDSPLLQLTSASLCVWGCCVHVWIVCIVCKLNTASDWLTNSYSTLANHHDLRSCLAPPSSPKKKTNSFAAPVAESQVGWQQLKWVASVYNAPHLIVRNVNGIVTMEIVISLVIITCYAIVAIHTSSINNQPITVLTLYFMH